MNVGSGCWISVPHTELKLFLKQACIFVYARWCGLFPSTEAISNSIHFHVLFPSIVLILPGPDVCFHFISSKLTTVYCSTLSKDSFASLMFHIITWISLLSLSKFIYSFWQLFVLFFTRIKASQCRGFLFAVFSLLYPHCLK